MSDKVGIEESRCNYRLLPQQKLQWICNQQHQQYEATPTPATALTNPVSAEDKPVGSSYSGNLLGIGSPTSEDNNATNNTASAATSKGEKKQKSPRTKRRKMHIPNFARCITRKRTTSASTTSAAALETTPYMELEMSDVEADSSHGGEGGGVTSIGVGCASDLDSSHHEVPVRRKSAPAYSAVTDAHSAGIADLPPPPSPAPLLPLSLLCEEITPPGRSSSCCGEVHASITAACVQEEKKKEEVEPAKLVLVPPTGN